MATADSNPPRSHRPGRAVPRRLPGRPGAGRQDDRGAGRGRRRRADGAVRRRARAARRRAGAGKTLLIRTLSQAMSMSFSPHPVHARPDARRHHRHGSCRAADATGSGFQFRPRGRCSPRSSSPTRSTAPRPRRSRRCSRRCRKVRDRRRPTYEMPKPSRDGDAEPDRAGGHLPAARGAARPLPAQARRRLRPRQELHEILNRTTMASRRRSSRCSTPERIVEHQSLVRRVVIAPHVQDYAIRGVLATHPEGEFASSLSKQFLRFGASPRGAAGAGAGREGQGPARRSGPRQHRRRAAGDAPRAAAPHPAELRGPGRGRDARHDPQRPGRPPAGRGAGRPRARRREVTGQYAPSHDRGSPRSRGPTGRFALLSARVGHAARGHAG